jgi:hypothetical protein
MRRLIPALFLFLLATTAFAGHGRHGGVNISIHDGDGLTDCGDLDVKFDGERAQVSSDEIPFGGKALRVRSEKHGGIRVSGWSGSSFGITVCKAVPAGTDASAIRVTMNGNEVTADGPDEGRWVAYYLIRAPRGAKLDLESTNGPISLDNVNGDITAEAINGPVSVKESSGTIHATTTNGPVSLAGGSGTVRLKATNGPLSVKLRGSVWDGDLQGSTQNGPLTLKIDRAFRSGVLVESLGHGPVTCRAEGCPEVRVRTNDWEDHQPRRIELGTGQPVVRLSTMNGPVSVKEMD